MGFTILLKFALLCVDLLAWPIIALGYPLFASIRAIETGSNHHMKKLLKLQAFIERLLKGERLRKREIYLDVLEQYIKENGSEGLEKLIALKRGSQKSINFQRETKILEPERNEPKAARRDTEMLKATEKSEATKAQRAQYPQSVSSAWVVKDRTKLEAIAENRLPETPPLKKAQQDWACDICKVTTTSEMDLNAHLHGSKHKSMLEFLKGSATPQKVQVQVKNSQTIKAIWVPKGKDVNGEVKEMPPPEASAQNRRAETPPQTPTAHLQGKFESLKTSELPSKGRGLSPSATCKANQGTELRDWEGSVKKSSKYRCGVCDVKLSDTRPTFKKQ